MPDAYREEAMEARARDVGGALREVEGPRGAERKISDVWFEEKGDASS